MTLQEAAKEKTQMKLPSLAKPLAGAIFAGTLAVWLVNIVTSRPAIHRYMQCYATGQRISCRGYASLNEAEFALREHRERYSNLKWSWVASCIGQECDASARLPKEYEIKEAHTE